MLSIISNLILTAQIALGVVLPPPQPIIQPLRVEASFEQETPLETIVEPLACRCVSYVRSLGLEVRGDAKYLETNSSPIKKGGVLLDYNGVRHIAYILELYKGGMWITEANFRSCVIDERLIEYDDPNIVGFINSKSPTDQ